MFFRPSAILFSIVALSGIVAAAPSALQARDDSSSEDQCNTGSIQCCNNTYDSDSEQVTQLFELMGLEQPSSSGSVGFGCSPITGTGSGSGSTCVSQPVCCEGDTFNGLINIGCVSITIIVL